jgi:hypothetical protein
MKSIVYLVTSEGMGNTSSVELKKKLIFKFLTLLQEARPLPDAICFYTDGVKLACQDSLVIEPLKKLESLGVRIILCQTCLEFFGLESKVEVGVVGGMGDIITCMTEADSVVTL